MLNVVDIEELGLKDPLGVPLTNDYAPGNNTSSPRYRVHKNKLILYISNTVINKFFERGEEIKYCPQWVFQETIIGKVKSPPTHAMNKGSYFETKCIGSGAGGSITDTLPLKNNGGITIDQKRIDAQVVQFKILAEKYKIFLSDDYSNVQVKEKKHYQQDTWADVEVFITGEADIISPLNYRGRDFQMANIDLKMTKDRLSTFGKYAWGNRDFINTQQGTIYWLLFNLPFFFWVFDHATKQAPSNEIIPVNHDVNHPNPALAQKAKWRIKSTHEVIRKTITEVAHNFIKGWPTNPDPDLCYKCPVKDCKDRNLLNEL